MERALQKLARQLNQYDSASLMSLWERYAQTVSRFEPTQRWEEAVLVFGMIQAVHWKNQLFNAEMMAGRKRPASGTDAGGPRPGARQGGSKDRENPARRDFGEKELKDKLKAYAGGKHKSAGSPLETPGPEAELETGESEGGRKQKQRRKVLFFPSRDGRKP